MVKALRVSCAGSVVGPGFCLCVCVGGGGQVWMSHSDKVTELPAGFHAIGSTASCENAAVSNAVPGGGFHHGFPILGVQYHPEVRARLVPGRGAWAVCPGCMRVWASAGVAPA